MAAAILPLAHHPTAVTVESEAYMAAVAAVAEAQVMETLPGPAVLVAKVL